MAVRVIQGFFVGGAFRAAGTTTPAPVRGPVPATSAPGRPPAAFGGAVALQARAAPGRPAPSHGPVRVAQPSGGDRSFAIDPAQVGLANGGGRSLPSGLLAKMEAAFAADFSAVRVHVGPQASRIGAIAFTTGDDLYFAPGQFQPDTISGQQLIGHELAHVIQQRQGRVRAPGSGVAVVQDAMLEAEADRLGMRAAAHRAPVQAKMAGSGRSEAKVHISAPGNTGPGSYRLTAGSGTNAIGSLVVHTRRGAVAEVTDLGVAAGFRDQGIGRQLLESAARAGLRSGNSKLSLSAQDNGSGKLTRWYKDMGFQQVGVNGRGMPLLEAPISRLLGATAQRRAAPPPIQAKASRPAFPHRGFPGPSGGSGAGHPRLGGGQAIQRSQPAYHRSNSFDLSNDDQNQMILAEKLTEKYLKQAYNFMIDSINDYKNTGNDQLAVAYIPGYVSGASNKGNGAPASWFGKFVEHMTGAAQHNQLATQFGTAVCEYTYYIMNGSTHNMMGNIALESPQPVTLNNNDYLNVDYTAIPGHKSSRPDIRVCLPTRGEGVLDITSSTAKVNHTAARGWATHTDVRYISELQYPGVTNYNITNPGTQLTRM